MEEKRELTKEMYESLSNALSSTLERWMFDNDYVEDVVLSGSFVGIDGDILGSFNLDMYLTDSTWPDDDVAYRETIRNAFKAWKSKLDPYRQHSGDQS